MRAAYGPPVQRDMERSLECVKPSVNQADLERQVEFMKDFGQEG